jgi:hypothetical protein
MTADNGDEMAEDKEREQKAPNALQVIGSVLAAGLGVQSSKNRERDFERGNPKVFIVAGLIFTVLFIATVITVVSTVLSTVD